MLCCEKIPDEDDTPSDKGCSVFPDEAINAPALAIVSDCRGLFLSRTMSFVVFVLFLDSGSQGRRSGT
jgi:hypothetical protein